METHEIDKLTVQIRVLKDMLAQKEQQLKALEGSNLFLKTLFDAVSEEVILVDENFNIEDVNQKFLNNYPLKKEAVVGKKCHEIIHQSNEPCKLEKHLCPLKEAKRIGKPVEVTHQHTQPDGDIKEMVEVMYPLPTGDQRAKLFLKISRDITDYGDLIRKLHASEKKFKAILDTATDAIISIDENHKIILFNNAAKQTFGYSKDEVLGKNLNLLIPPRYGDHYSFIKEFMETREPKVMGKNLSLSALRKNGEKFPVEIGLSHHEMDGKITFTAIIRDVSAQRQLEKKLLQTERLAAVGQTVAHVAHEIKNPLMIIGGFSHQIKSSLVDEKAIQKLDMIFDEIGRLENLVANLGDFTKVYNLVKRPSDINSVIQDVLKIMTEIYPADKYAFKTDFFPNLEEINCDPDKLKQVFINIITNGIAAMDDGGTVRVSTGKCPDGIEIRLSDEGIGIPEDDLLRVFEPFYTTRDSGSGLGLSISYKVVEAHKGEIWADSTPGEGATFVVRLPVR